jgi:transcription elongation factor Elf1
MAQVVCSDCPNCNHENWVNLGSHEDLKQLPDIRSITCGGCFRSYQTTSEDFVLREKAEDEIAAHRGLFTSISWV